MDDVAERLKDTAVYEYDKRASDYSPWKWQHVVAIIVFVVVFAAWRFLYDGYQRLLRSSAAPMKTSLSLYRTVTGHGLTV